MSFIKGHGLLTQSSSDVTSVVSSHANPGRYFQDTVSYSFDERFLRRLLRRGQTKRQHRDAKLILLNGFCVDL